MDSIGFANARISLFTNITIYKKRIAAKLHNKLIKEAEMLRTFPNAGNILNTSERVTLCYRALVVDTNYKLIYYVDANKDVIIVTVWDVRQNPDKLTKTIE